MESPEAFLINFFAARNALFRRQQKELEAFQQEFCQGSLIYDKRLTGYVGERILEAVWLMHWILSARAAHPQAQ